MTNCGRKITKSYANFTIWCSLSWILIRKRKVFFGERRVTGLVEDSLTVASINIAALVSLRKKGG